MAITQANWASVLRLQKKQINATPMSYDEAVYDKAVDLALGRLNEPETEYFSHNCYRNARTHVARSQSKLFVISDFEKVVAASIESNQEDFVYLSEIFHLELSPNGVIEEHLMHCVSGRTCKDISEATGQSIGAVKKARQRALKKLRGKLSS